MNCLIYIHLSCSIFMNSWKEECPGCGSISLLVKQFGMGTHGSCRKCGFEMNIN